MIESETHSNSPPFYHHIATWRSELGALSHGAGKGATWNIQKHFTAHAMIALHVSHNLVQDTLCEAITLCSHCHRHLKTIRNIMTKTQKLVPNTKTTSCGLALSVQQIEKLVKVAHTIHKRLQLSHRAAFDPE